MSPGSNSRPPRRDDARSSGPRRPSGKPGTSGGKPGSGSRAGKPAAGGRGRGGTDDRRGGRPDKRSDSRGRPVTPMTEAERRSKAVKERRAPRAPQDPDVERRKIEGRTTEQWIDEGSVRREATGAARRAAGGDAPPARRVAKPLDPEVAAELTEALGSQRGARLTERLAQASEALDRERFQEARRIATAISKEAPSVSAAHELLGLASYRLGLYKQAVSALELAQELHSNPALLPVIADCQRAQGRWAAVDRVWTEIKGASPSHEIMAEGRMVAAGALADQGELRAALELMEPATKRPKVVRDFHLRQWYVVADLYDRTGDPISARRWFSSVLDFDDEFGDVRDRLRGLGR